MDMADRHEVVLEVATLRDAALLSNLLELYLHDLSEAFPVELGADELHVTAPRSRFHRAARGDGQGPLARISQAPADFGLSDGEGPNETAAVSRESWPVRRCE